MLAYILHRLLYRPLREAVDQRREAICQSPGRGREAARARPVAFAETLQSEVCRHRRNSGRRSSARPASRRKPSGKS